MTTATIYIQRHEGETTKIPPGQTFFSEGEPGDLMYVVESGEADVILNGKVIETIGPGGIVGEMALIDAQPRSATVIARTDCALIPVDAKRFLRLVQHTPYFAIQVMQILTTRLRRHNNSPHRPGPEAGFLAL
jgi:CRP/FNR family cyclic AMP-dependent transcriptional regulator